MLNTTGKWTCLAVAGMVGMLLAAPLAAQEAGRTLSLREAVSLAVQNSGDLAVARARYDVSERAEGLTRSAFHPNLFTGSGAAYTNGFPLGAPTVFNVNYVQTLFNRPARGEVRANQQESEMRKAGLDTARDAVILRAASAYLELVKVRHALELLGRERASATKVLEVTRERVAVGVELPIEVTRAQLAAARIEQRIAQLEGREETLQSELRSLTGLPHGQRIEVTQEEIPAGLEDSVGQLVETALANHPELREAEFQRRAQEERLKGEKGGYLPTLDVVGQYGLLTRFNNYDDFYNRFERHNLVLGVQVRFPIFSSRTSAAVGLAQSRLIAAEAELRNKRNAVETDVRRQAHRSKEVDATRKVARLELQLAQENVRVLQEQFEVGSASLRDLERARLEEMDKYRQFLDSDFARQQARLELLKATGQLAKVFQ